MNNDLENMTKSLFLTITFCAEEARSYMEQIGEWLLSQSWVQGILLQALCAYSRFVVSIEKWWARNYGSRFPNSEKPWMSVSTVTKTTFDFCEVFYRDAAEAVAASDQKQNQHDTWDCVWLSKTDALSSGSAFLSKTDALSSGSAFLSKTDALSSGSATEAYVVARRGTFSNDPTASVQPSKMRFLSICYKHPDLGESVVPLDIPLDMMVVDNEILSPAFVRRLLPGSTPFDNRYWLECIDNHISFIKLTSTEYIVLAEDGWNRVKI